MESFKEIDYKELTSVQKESYAFCQIQAVMSKRGWLEYHRLNDDHNGADWVSFHIDGKTERFQQKSRFTLSPKYYGKGLKVMVYSFADDSVYMYDHDDNFDAWEEKRQGLMHLSISRQGVKVYKDDFLRSKTIPSFAIVNLIK